VAAESISLPGDASLEILFRDLLAKAHHNRPKDDLAVLERAYEFARTHHTQQIRASGEPYMTHPLKVSHILADMRMDMVCLVTGLLHDVVEDTQATIDDVRKIFGDEVARVVDGVTKLSKLDFFSAEERQAESYRKMMLAMVSDIRVMLVKLADRLHNMRTLASLSPDRQDRIARETIEIYAPIAHRLGMGKMRGELEDLAFRYQDPLIYDEICKAIESQRGESERFLEKIKHSVEKELQEEGIPGRVEGRVKRAYSVYLKLQRQKISIDQVYDLMALRIITDSVKNCYGALGIIHTKWHPIPGRIKDFIAIPRPNLYQSLHTSVMGDEGRHFEVQIRTEEMHRVAEEGIAAHWKYKEGRKSAEDDKRIAWLRHMVEWQSGIGDPAAFLSLLKTDLQPDDVHTFTPRGKIVTLPRDATPIDFAYAIHSDVGNTCTGAKVNGRMVPLKYTLKDGDSVEILTTQGHAPSKDWLSIVKTARARNRIRHVITVFEREKAIEIGEKYLEKEARRLGVAMNRVRPELGAVAGDYGFGREEDLFAALGFGKFSARQVLQKSLPDHDLEAAPPPEVPQPEKRDTRLDTGAVVRVRGIDDLMIYRANCCNPIRGETIVGYVTRGKGIAVHAKNCPNVQNLMYEVERKIDVEWERSAQDSFPVRLIVRTDDRPGLLHQVTQILSNEDANIRNLEAKTDVEGSSDGASIEMSVDIRDKKQMEKLVSAMRRLSGVRDVERLM
jgi:guanosine-3',5'-bis(diphosphate) 3'-pyrophosphohydrolase